MKTALTTLITATLFLILLPGCEGFRCAKGVVRDKLTGNVLDSVLVNAISGDKKSYTDANGKFGICNPLGGCMTHCKDIMVEFSKAGYKTFTLQNPEDSVVVQLERL